jgi:long-chain acyl-CoA synthetase
LTDQTPMRAASNATTLEDAVRLVTTTNPVFALEEAEIRGVRYTVFRNAPDHVAALVDAGRELHGNGAAEYLVYADKRWTYDEFRASTQRLARALAMRHDVGPGDRVALACRNCPEMLMAILALASLGAVTVFLNAWWTEEELDYALEDSDARVVLADAKRLERLRRPAAERDVTLIGIADADDGGAGSLQQVLEGVVARDWPEANIAPDDDFAIMYSSGTTGHPKGVVQTHRGAVNAVYSWAMQPAVAAALEPPDPAAPAAPRPVGMVATPLFHVTATHPIFLLSLVAGAKLVLLDKWDPAVAARLIEDEKVTRFLGVPTQSADLISAADEAGLSLESLDYLGAGGAKRPAAQVGELAQRFPKAGIATGWGMTETNALGIGMIGDEYLARPASAGRLHPPLQELRFLDEDGRDVPPGAIGEITVKSPCNMRCYLNKPDATAEVLQDGWLRTGDLGLIDEDGYVTIVDRRKNIVIRGGENISCLDVEGALHRHPAVAEACAFSLPHPRLGEVVGAAVTLRPDAQPREADLQAELERHIAGFKIPERIWMQTDPLPRGATDKIDRRGVRARCLRDWPFAEPKG